MPMRLLRVLLGLAALASLAPPAFGVACSSVATGNWSAAATWAAGCPAGGPSVNDTATINNGHTVTLDASPTVRGITVNNGGILQLGNNATARTLTVFDPTAAAGFITTVGSGTVRTNAASNTTHSVLLEGNLTNAGTFNMATDANSLANVTLNGAGAQTVSGAGATMQFFDLTISSAGLASFSRSFSVAGNLSDNGNFRHSGAASRASFNGTAAQSLLGTAADTTFQNVTLANTAAVANRSLTLAHDMTVVTNLTFTAGAGSGGRVVTGASKVVVQASGAAAITNACPTDANDYIAGNLQLAVAAGASTVNFPIGTNGALAPALACSQLSLTFAGAVAGSLIASATQGDHPQIGGSGLDAANSVNRYWTLTTSGVAGPALGFASYAATFYFIAGDVDAGATPTAFIATRYDGAAWSATNVGAAAATSTGIVSETALGQFALGEALGFNVNAGSAGRFDAYDPAPATPAGSVRGNLRTKEAGTAFSLSIVHLNVAGTVLANLNANVTVDLVDASPVGGVFTNNCSSLWTTVIATSGSVAFGGGNTMNQVFTVNNAYRNVRVKVTRAGGGEVGCSGDAFAIRPAGLLLEALDTDWLSAGTTRLLHNAGAAGGNVHASSTAAAPTPRPFTLRATARNAGGITASNYSGTPTVRSGPTCVLPVGCTNGTLDLAAWASAAGVAVTTAHYSEVGTFNLEIEDSTFAAVDAADTSQAQRRVPQAAPSPREIGRFVPEHFFVAAGSTLTNRSAAACAPASSFTYLNEGIGFAFTLHARNAAGSITQNYTGALAKLNPASIDQLGFAAVNGATNLTPRLDTSAGSAGAFVSGVSNVTATVAVRRAVPDNPDGPFSALRLGVAPAEPAGGDGVTVRSADMNMDVDGVGGNDHVQLGGNTIARFGRLRLENAVGAETLPLTIGVRAEHWNGTAFAINADDACTGLSRSDIALDFSPPSNLSACETAVSTPGVVLTGGVGSIVLTAAGAGNNGTVWLTANLGSGGGTYCNPGSAVAATNAGRAYLLGRWDDAADPDANGNTAYDDKPRARAVFGLYGAQPNNLIYFRENY